MDHGVYIGSDTSLLGKGALVMDDPESSTRMVLAQFDDISLPEAFGWHPFFSYDFRMDPKVDWDKP